jgi:hypothetical protein
MQILIETTTIGKNMRVEPRAEIKYATFALYDDGE